MAKLSPKSVFKSASGLELPVVGLGTWNSRDSDVETAVEAALEAGYPLIDTAHIYHNESVIGRVLQEWFCSGKLKREDVFITTKLPFQGNHPEHVQVYLEQSLKALQLDYVDLYLVHHAVGFKHVDSVKNADGSLDFSKLQLDMNTDHVAIWKEMEKQVDAGRTKAIGVSNYNIGQIERIIKIARIPPANLQLEMYLYNQGKEIQKYCHSKGITITSYSTLGSPGSPDAFFTKGKTNPMEDPVVVQIAETHGKTAAQVLLRHMIQSGVAVIPKSVSPNRVQENLQLFDFQLSESEMEELNDLDRGEDGRLFGMSFMKDHPEYPFPK